MHVPLVKFYPKRHIFPSLCSGNLIWIFGQHFLDLKSHPVSGQNLLKMVTHATTPGRKWNFFRHEKIRKNREGPRRMLMNECINIWMYKCTSLTKENKCKKSSVRPPNLLKKPSPLSKQSYIIVNKRKLSPSAASNWICKKTAGDAIFHLKAFPVYFLHPF